jgi:hypothetical protein
MLITEKDLDVINRFISKEYGDLKIEGRYKSDIIILQSKLSLRADDKNKIRNAMTL